MLALPEMFFRRMSPRIFQRRTSCTPRENFPTRRRLTKKFLQTGGQSPALLFNYANAEFKCRSSGQGHRRLSAGAQLSPRDAELRANLAFVRNQVQGAAARESRWQNWAGMLTLNEGAVLTAVLFWLTFALLIARQLRPALVPKLRTATRISSR